MSKPRTTSGKRNLQQQKREKAQAKAARRAARREVDPETNVAPVEASEAELIGELAQLHHAAEAGQVSQQEFEERREAIRMQMEQIEGREK